ncbi:hypothetical protein IWX50DRAFT_292882 [Phyllosticta citricarpa]
MRHRQWTRSHQGNHDARCRHDKPRSNPAVQSVQRASLRGVWLRAASRAACARLDARMGTAVSVSMQTNARDAQNGTLPSPLPHCVCYSILFFFSFSFPFFFFFFFFEAEPCLSSPCYSQWRDPCRETPVRSVTIFSPSLQSRQQQGHVTNSPTNHLSKHPVRRDCAHLPGIRQGA